MLGSETTNCVALRVGDSNLYVTNTKHYLGRGSAVSFMGAMQCQGQGGRGEHVL